MTAEEALSIVETVLENKRLNDVQVLIFKQCWEGRKSYEEIASRSGYENGYIKYVASRLWKLLSERFGERVKKTNLQSVLKRYSRVTQINSRNHIIEVNLNGANLTGATLSVADLSGSRLCANSNLSEVESCQSDLRKGIMADEDIELDEEIVDDQEGNNQGVQSESEAQIYYWNELQFRSLAEVKIAEALDRTQILFLPNSKMRLTMPEGRQNQAPNFLIFHQGKWGILEVGYSDTVRDEERDRTFQSHGIHIVEHYDATRCNEQPDEVVQEFLQNLSQA